MYTCLGSKIPHEKMEKKQTRKRKTFDGIAIFGIRRPQAAAMAGGIFFYPKYIYNNSDSNNWSKSYGHLKF